MNEEELIADAIKSLTTDISEKIDKVFFEGLSLLSIRKKKKIKKWIFKALKRKNKENCNYENEIFNN